MDRSRAAETRFATAIPSLALETGYVPAIFSLLLQTAQRDAASVIMMLSRRQGAQCWIRYVHAWTGIDDSDERGIFCQSD